MNKIARFILFDILKNKIVILYTILLFIISWAVLGLDNNYTKATLSLLNVDLSTFSNSDKIKGLPSISI